MNSNPSPFNWGLVDETTDQQGVLPNAFVQDSPLSCSSSDWTASDNHGLTPPTPSNDVSWVSSHCVASNELPNQLSNAEFSRLYSSHFNSQPGDQTTGQANEGFPHQFDNQLYNSSDNSHSVLGHAAYPDTQMLSEPQFLLYDANNASTLLGSQPSIPLGSLTTALSSGAASQPRFSQPPQKDPGVLYAMPSSGSERELHPCNYFARKGFNNAQLSAVRATKESPFYETVAPPGYDGTHYYPAYTAEGVVVNKHQHRFTIEMSSDGTPMDNCFSHSAVGWQHPREYHPDREMVYASNRRALKGRSDYLDDFPVEEPCPGESYEPTVVFKPVTFNVAARTGTGTRDAFRPSSPLESESPGELIDLYGNSTRETETRVYGGALMQIGSGARVENVLAEKEYKIYRSRQPVELSQSIPILHASGQPQAIIQVSATRMLRATRDGYRHMTTDFYVPREHRRDFFVALNVDRGRVDSEPMTVLDADASQPWAYCSTVLTKGIFVFAPNRHKHKVRLRYQSSEEAEVVVERFRKGKDGAFSYEFDHVGPVSENALQVEVSGFPLDWKADRILAHFSDDPVPIHLEFVKTGQQIIDEAKEAARQAFKSLDPGVKMEDFHFERSQQVVLGEIRFSEEQCAQACYAAFHGIPQKGVSELRCALKLLPLVQYQILPAVYKAVASSIESGLDELQLNGLGRTPEPPISGGFPFQTYTLEAYTRDLPSLKKAKDCLNKILRGREVKNGQYPLWNSLLDDPKAPFEQLDMVRRLTGVVIIRDMQHRTLRLFGQLHACDQAEKQLIEAFGQSNKFMLPLDDIEFHGHHMRILRAVLADGKATLHMPNDKSNQQHGGASNGRRLVIEGTTTHHSNARWFLNHLKMGSGQLCIKCGKKAVCPIRLACGHLYGIVCLRQQSMSNLGFYDSGVGCVGDNCQELIPLDLMKEVLIPYHFEKVLYAAMHRISNTDISLRVCSTPDCSHVYRARLDAPMMDWRWDHTARRLCSGCLTVTCTFCDRQHRSSSLELPRESDPELRVMRQGSDMTDDESEALPRICPSCNFTLSTATSPGLRWCTRCGWLFCWECQGRFNPIKKTDGRRGHLNIGYVTIKWLHNGDYTLKRIGIRYGDPSLYY